ncbi:MAG TPA: zf-HC2 domain-containing protein [Thermoanaerobaculia bacterium]|nr:zf-HC2 domain-containing protein [Thermoanaerobaculia bacterium]
MDHPSIDEELVPERYVAGRLSPEEREKFEEHFFECPACIETVELVRRFRDDLRETFEATPPAPRAGRPPAFLTLLLAASLLVAVSAALHFYRSATAARREAESLRAAAAAKPANVPAAIGAGALSSAPRAASVFTLNLTRDASSTPEHRIAVGGPEHWVVLLYDEPDTAAAPFRVMLVTADGRHVGSPLDAAPASGGLLAASFPSSLVPPGDYALIVGRGALAPSDRLATYRFRAVP